MTSNRKSLLRTTMLVAVGSLLIAAPGSAQTADVAGEWTLTVLSDQGTTNPKMVLEQDGETLSGTYVSDALGEHSVSGSVDGTTIRISFFADLEGQSFAISYRGTLGEDGVITGTLDIADGAMQGSFTASRGGG
jgi:hypothetical protein